MAEHLNMRKPSLGAVAKVDKWEVIDRVVRVVLYLLVIYLIWKIFHVPIP